MFPTRVVCETRVDACIKNKNVLSHNQCTTVYSDCYTDSIYKRIHHFVRWWIIIIVLCDFHNIIYNYIVKLIVWCFLSRTAAHLRIRVSFDNGVRRLRLIPKSFTQWDGNTERKVKRTCQDITFELIKLQMFCLGHFQAPCKLTSPRHSWCF